MSDGLSIPEEVIEGYIEACRNDPGVMGRAKEIEETKAMDKAKMNSAVSYPGGYPSNPKSDNDKI